MLTKLALIFLVIMAGIVVIFGRPRPGDGRGGARRGWFGRRRPPDRGGGGGGGDDPRA